MYQNSIILYYEKQQNFNCSYFIGTSFIFSGSIISCILYF